MEDPLRLAWIKGADEQAFRRNIDPFQPARQG
jgi:hypothetical protein